MLSAALRGAPPAVGGQPMGIPIQARLPPAVLPAALRATMASSAASSLDDPLFDSPRPAQVFPPHMKNGRASAHVEVDAESEDEEVDADPDLFEPDDLDAPSAASSQTQHPARSYLSTPGAAGPLTSASTPILQSAGGSGDGMVIGRAAMCNRGSMGDLQAELEHLSSCGGGRGSRPIGIPRGGMSSTYHPAAGMYMPGFVPPHELVAASVQGSDPMIMHSHRHKSTAERLRTAVFEQTGVVSVATATAFLQQVHTFQPAPAKV